MSGMRTYTLTEGDMAERFVSHGRSWIDAARIVYIMGYGGFWNRTTRYRRAS